MRVQEVILEGKVKRYILVNNDGYPEVAVIRYLKFLDATKKAPNTQKSYCYALKHYFTFLYEKKLHYKSVRLEDLRDFISWLRSPYISPHVTSLKPTIPKRKERSINHTITVVTGFYDYLYRNEEIENNMIEKLLKQVYLGGKKRYKDFFHHVNKAKPSPRNILILKEPKKKIKILSKEDVKNLLAATTNIRDKLLIQVLFETGLRIGEALSLFIEDFIFDHKNGHRLRLVDRGELENGGKLKTGEREIYISQELMDTYDDYLYEVLDEIDIDSNFLFVKLRGRNTGEAMNYQDVSSLFRRLNKKTGLQVNPHMFRHTHATLFYLKTRDIKQVQERLGHSQIQTTSNFYLHPSDEEIRKSWEQAQSAFKIN
ncbi:tyrosine-type recombinase/integrase [Bacillus sp. ISL-35]|uniref:tyrosine-type recombinase/integrase n=1 Tax=Bacillus sp. ISL-35 TaxID=2819122 RepID=UPI001BEB9C54|nr:tyrosine-type recombinase/integrase [Bacillus sp. ISL-35]MBT2681808.1 tyrosine-type recombinase/integrase [Bacillus sp. ISL-35]MBT2701956.1 tyrosine-type recombinase/integrase [Chryseobacterium sp. ISL-80]